ncbi:S8 family serine peptidase [Streptomyces sp. NBC_00075]|uniref:S8 family serine peptidase n=1 Tax=Streptomyces sp. NBC_00075 TaxID=2975641 RepID=UPI00324BB6EA
MTGRIGPRLSALLSDLGVAHPDDPDPRPRSFAPEGEGAVPGPGAPVAVVLSVGPVDIGELSAAGLHLPRGGAPLVTGMALPPSVPAIALVPGVRSVELAAAEYPDLHTSVPATRADHVRTGALGLTGAGVIVGVVDTGIDIYHHAFRNSDGTTRLLSLLDTTTPYTLTGSGPPTAGTFRLGWTPPATGGAVPAQQTTANLPFNATVQQVRAALEALAAIEPGDVLATGGPLPGTPVVVSFAGRYLNQDVEPLRVSASALTPAATAIVIDRGREYTREQINAALAAPAAPFGSFDADGHGTHVMGIAAGDGSQAGNCHLSDYYIGVAPAADLIAVKTTFSNDATTRGVRHVFDRATALGRAAVVNLSLGGQDGAHDGSADDEVLYDQLLTTTPAGRAIVVSAGNDGDRYDHSRPDEQPRYGGGVHAFKTVPPGGTVTMEVVLPPQDRQDDWLEFWYAGAGRLSLQLREPGGAVLAGPVAPGAPVYTTPLAGHDLRIRNRTNDTPTSRHTVSVRISPPAAGTITAGTWRFTLTETAGTETEVDCWIGWNRKDPHPRFTEADQDRTRTLTTPATAHNVITVASYNPADNELAASSSRGPTTDVRPADERKPDIAAPGVGITSAKSLARNTGICCDCCEDFYVAMSGTSMAAPHITGIIALIFQRNRALTWEQVRAHLRTTAVPPDPITGPTLPNAEWGSGVVNAEVCIAGIPAHASTTHAPTAAYEKTLEPAGLPDGPRVPALVPQAGGQPGDPTSLRLRELRRTVQNTEAGQLAAALVSTHIDEVLRLVNQERRVTIAWHRMGGAELFRLLLATPVGEPLVVPGTFGGRPLAEGLARLLDALEAAGSPQLRADIARHRALLLSLPGRDLDDLDDISRAG